MKRAYVLVISLSALAGCGMSEKFSVPYAQAVSALKELYPVPAGRGSEYMQELSIEHPAYAPESMDDTMLEGFSMRQPWGLRVTHEEVAPGREYVIRINKTWKSAPARETTIRIRATSEAGVDVQVSSRKRTFDIWFRDFEYEDQRQREIARTLGG